MNRSRFQSLVPLILALALAGCGDSETRIVGNADLPSLVSATVPSRIDPIAGDQEDAEIAADSRGNFVVVWEQLSPSAPDLADIRGQRFSPSGGALGQPFTIASSPDHDFRPSVASGLNGSFVVSWSRNEPDLDRTLMLARRYDGQDQPLGVEFQVSQDSLQYEESGDIAADAQGNFVVTWAGSDTSEPQTILARPYAADGTPKSDAFDVDTPADPVSDPSVASDADGNFTVVWSRLSAIPDVMARRYNSAGTAIGEGQVLGPSDGASRFSPEIDVTPEGEAEIVYTHAENEGASLRIAALRLDNTGAVEGNEVFLSSSQKLSFDPAVALLPDGSFTACWEEVLEGEHDILQIGRFASDGTPIAPLSRLGTASADDEFDGFFDVSADGTLGASWDEASSIGDDTSAQRAYVRFYPAGTP